MSVHIGQSNFKETKYESYQKTHSGVVFGDHSGIIFFFIKHTCMLWCPLEIEKKKKDPRIII